MLSLRTLSFMTMNNNNITNTCEDWNRRMARKKPAVTSSTCSGGDSIALWRAESTLRHSRTMWPPTASGPTPAVLTCLATGSGWPGRESGADDLRNSPHFNQSHAQILTSSTSSPTHSQRSHQSPVATGNWRTSKCGCTHAAAMNLHTGGFRPYGRFFTRSKQ